MNLETLRFISLCVGLLSVGMLESFLPARSWLLSRKTRWGFHLSTAVLNTFLTRWIGWLPLGLWTSYVLEKGWGLSQNLGLQGLPEILCTVLLFDLFTYSWHRLNHEVPFLWRFHRFHHWDKEMDVTTALRFQPGELVLSYAFKALWILVWGPTWEAFIIFETCITLASLFHHSNMRLPIAIESVLGKVFMTPYIHAGHHTVSEETRDNNYSTIFIFWDKIFRTHVRPEEGDLKYLGTPDAPQNNMSYKAYWTSPWNS